MDGLVEQVSVSKKGHAFLNFGGHYPNQIFTGFVPAGAVRCSAWLNDTSGLALLIFDSFAFASIIESIRIHLLLKR